MSTPILRSVLTNKNFWLALVITITASIGNACVKQPVNLLSSELGLSVSVFGFVSSIYIMFSMLGSGPFSNAVERFRRKTWILSGQYVARGLVFLGFGLCASAPLYIFLKFMQGLTFGMGHIAMMIVIAKTMDKRALGSAFGLIVLFTKLLSSITNSVSLGISATFGIEYSCFAGAVISLVPALLCLFLRMPNDEVPAPREQRVVGLRTFINIRAVPLLLILVLVCVPSMFVDNFLVLYGNSAGLGEQVAGYISGYMWWMGIGSFVAGYVYDRLGFKPVAVVLCVLGVVAQATLSTSTDAGIWAFSSLCCGLASGGIATIMRSYSVSQCPAGSVSLTVATFGIMQDLSNLTSTTVGGVMAENLGYTLTMQISCLCPLLALLIVVTPALPMFVSLIKKQ